MESRGIELLELSVSVELLVGAPLLTVEQADGLEAMELAAPLELELVAPLEPSAPLRGIFPMSIAARVSCGTREMVGRRSGTGNQNG